jgi:hypothetical protein
VTRRIQAARLTDAAGRKIIRKSSGERQASIQTRRDVRRHTV